MTLAISRPRIFNNHRRKQALSNLTCRIVCCIKGAVTCLKQRGHKSAPYFNMFTLHSRYSTDFTVFSRLERASYAIDMHDIS